MPDLNQLLRIDPANRVPVYLTVFRGADFRDWNYWIELLLAAGIATSGLILNSPAVIIGAMLISPLMSPIIAVALALAAADVYLAVRAAVNLLASISGSILVSALITWVLPFHSPTSEILARTHPSLLDLGVAVFSGTAGALLLIRGGGGGGLTAMPGVAIAVSLIPPLCTVGFGLGAGPDGAIMGGAMLLFLTNLAAIIACGFVLFLAARMEAPEVREAIANELAQHGERDVVFRSLQRLLASERVRQAGRLPYRIGLIVVSLLLLGPSLVSGFREVRDETTARVAISRVTARLLPRQSVVSITEEITRSRIAVNIVVTDNVPPERAAEAEKELARITGKDVTYRIRKVASAEELVRLQERLTRPSAPPPDPEPPKELGALTADLQSRLAEGWRGLWPPEAGALLSRELVVSDGPVRIRVSYEAPQDVDPLTARVWQGILRDRLRAPDLELELIRQRPAARRGAPKS